MAGGGLRDQRQQVELETVPDHRAQHAERGPAQRERIARAGGRLADAEDAGQRVEPVGQRERDADLAACEFITRVTRQVLFGERSRDFGILAVVQCVVAPHDALQFVELEHHLAHQVGLRELGGARAQRGIGVDRRADRACEPRQAFGLVPQRAQIGLEHDLAQPFAARRECGLPVLLVEEGRIAEARTDHALVAVDDFLWIAAVDVRYRHEARQQGPAAVDHVEILLVLLHRGNQRFGRHLQEALLEAPGQRARPFDQAADFLEQFVVDHCAAAEPGGLGTHLFGDRGAALLVVGDHRALFVQRLRVAFGTGERDARRAVHAVSARLASGRDAEHASRDHGIAVQQHHPVHRAHEFGAACAPAHALGDRQRGECRLHQRRQQCRRRLSGHLLAKRQPFALVPRDALQFIDRHPAAARETERRAGGLAVGAEGGGNGRSQLLGHGVGLRGRHRIDLHREPPRRRVPAHLAMRDALFVQPLGQRGGERGRERAQAARWQFLGADLHQQRGVVHRAISPAASSSARSSGAASGKPSALRISW